VGSPAPEPPLAGKTAQRRRSETLEPRPGPQPFSPAAGADGGDSGCQKIIADFKQDGFSVLRNVLPQAVIEGALQGMNKILDGYAKHLQMRSFINSTFSDLPLDERALTIFQDNPEAVPKFFRSELHGSPEFFDLLAHRVVRRIASCILKTQTLVLYPVYMGRMNLPNLKQNLNGFHQDSLYTYEYFNINASAESMEMLMSSQVNFWAPLKDVSRESGTLVIRRGAENRICRYGELERRVYGERVAELVTDPSELPEEELVLLDDLKAGDLVVFAHHRPHRGTPNRAPGRVRWSMDWRVQSGHVGTMREESGYLVQSDLWEDARLVTRERWGEVAPSPRWSERRSGHAALAWRGGMGWRMELDGSHTATSPDVCVPDGRSSAKKTGRRQASGCHRLHDHP